MSVENMVMQVNGNVGVLASIAACIRALKSGVGVPILSSDECIRLGEKMDETAGPYFERPVRPF